MIPINITRMSRNILLKSPAVYSLVVVAVLQVGFSSAGEQSGCSRTLEISSGSVYATSYPLLVSLKTCNVDYEYGVAAYVADLGTPFGLKSPIQFQLSKKDHPDEFILFGKYSGDTHDPTPRAPQVFLTEDSCISATFDLFQSLPVQGHELAITPGTWMLRACKAGFLHAREKPFCSNEIEISVREPSDSEAQIARVFRKNSSWRSWFPKAAVNGRRMIGESGDLPPETRRVVELIRVLGDALESDGQCVFAIGEAEANGVDWGPISTLISGIQYECALETGDKMVANAASKKLDSAGGGDLATARIENGDGLISHLREYRDQRSKE